MRIYTIIFVIFFIAQIDLKGQNTVNTIVNQHHLGAWAFNQHKVILATIENLLTDKKIDVYTPEGKKYSYREIRKKYFNYYAQRYVNEYGIVGFKDSDLDTVYKFIGIDWIADWYEASKVRVTRDYIITDFGYNAYTLYFLRSDLEPQLSKDARNYIKLFSDGYLNLDSIPVRSERIYNRLKKQLYNESCSGFTKHYRDNTLVEIDSGYNNQGLEVVDFIQTDPEDSTIGKDSVYYIPVPYDTAIIKRRIMMSFYFNENILIPSSISSCLMYTKRPNDTKYWQTLGYIPLNEIQSFNATDLEVLNSLLILKMMNKMGCSEISEYLSHFQIREETED